MQAIVTKYYGATNTKPSKIVAKSASGLKVSVSYDDEYNADDNHKRAAQKLCDKYNWPCELIGGGLSNSEEVWVMIPRHLELVERKEKAA